MNEKRDARVSDGLPPYIPKEVRALVFGSFPSPATRSAGFHFGHPQNRFWPALAGALNEPKPTTQAERDGLLEKGGILLWNIVSACEIDGAKDDSIRNAELNPLDEAIARYHITKVFALGKKAATLYEKHFEMSTGVPCTVLPSPSPANRRYSLDALITAYRAIVKSEDGEVLK